MEKISFFLPTRKGSLRVKNKNTKSFAGIEGGLLANKLQQLIKCKYIDEIILSTNDDESIMIANKFRNCDKLRIDIRPDSLCLDSTNLQDLISYVPTITDAEHILWGHVTTPIADSTEYDQAIQSYQLKLKEGYDSLISVCEFKNFLLDETGNIVNNSASIPWPRTQDLDSLYEVNHVIFLTNRNVYVRDKNRIGKKPFLHIMDKIKSFDIDWNEDFIIAETIFKSIYK